MTLTGSLTRRLIFSGAVISGAGVGIGAGAIAGLGLAYWGFRQARRYKLTGKRPEALRARQLLVDRNIQAQVDEAIRDVRQELGEIDVLVNNAGTITVGPMDTMTEDEYRESLDVFFWGPLHTTLAVLPEMRKRHSGRIVNISSIGGKISVPHLLPYSVGKFALAGFSEGLRAELKKDNIYVTTIYPGLMRTGSPRNADFKGKHRAEYTWFLLSDATPGISVNADRAARQIVTACEYGKTELILTVPAKIAIKAHALFPSVSSAVLSSVNRALPEPGDLGKAKAKGAASTTRVTESWLSTLDERAAKRNNQVPNPIPVNL
jgi:short-subunit dehydrogenase